ncbi:hypothetical protein WJ32_18290 (plasmid) [Burkholderia ubonensis]|nr:hypothetical protein WJ32_18290 [Burkholderia ubonensis]
MLFMEMFDSTVSCIYCASRILPERRESSCIQSAVVQNLHGLGQDYRPGNLAGDGQRRLHYGENSRIVPQFQINVTPKGADQGALADTNNTAGTIVTRA